MQIQIGKTYDVVYKEYNGPALCIKVMENGQFAFAVSNIRALILNKSSVVRESKSVIKLHRTFIKSLIKKLEGLN